MKYNLPGHNSKKKKQQHDGTISESTPRESTLGGFLFPDPEAPLQNTEKESPTASPTAKNQKTR